MAKVVFVPGPNSHQFQKREIKVLEEVKVGRSVARCKTAPDNAIFDCKVLSRSHAVMWYQDGAVWIRDTKSSNGTFINSARLSKGGEESEPCELRSGDVIQFGVDVMETKKKDGNVSAAVTHGCIIANATVVIPTNPPPNPDSVSPFIMQRAGINIGTISRSASAETINCEEDTDIRDLHAVIKDALQRENLLNKRLQEVEGRLGMAIDAAELGWQALIKEDKLLARIELLESQLEIFTRDPTEYQNRIITLEEEKHKYQIHAKDSLRLICQEKSDALRQCSDLENSLTAGMIEVQHYKGLYDTTLEDQLKSEDSLRKKVAEVEEADKVAATALGEVKAEHEATVEGLNTRVTELEQEKTEVVTVHEEKEKTLQELVDSLQAQLLEKELEVEAGRSAVAALKEESEGVEEMKQGLETMRAENTLLKETNFTQEEEIMKLKEECEGLAANTTINPDIETDALQQRPAVTPSDITIATELAVLGIEMGTNTDEVKEAAEDEDQENQMNMPNIANQRDSYRDSMSQTEKWFDAISPSSSRSDIFSSSFSANECSGEKRYRSLRATKLGAESPRGTTWNNSTAFEGSIAHAMALIESLDDLKSSCVKFREEQQDEYRDEDSMIEDSVSLEQTDSLSSANSDTKISSPLRRRNSYREACEEDEEALPEETILGDNISETDDSQFVLAHEEHEEKPNSSVILQKGAESPAPTKSEASNPDSPNREDKVKKQRFEEESVTNLPLLLELVTFADTHWHVLTVCYHLLTTYTHTHLATCNLALQSKLPSLSYPDLDSNGNEVLRASTQSLAVARDRAAELEREIEQASADNELSKQKITELEKRVAELESVQQDNLEKLDDRKSEIDSLKREINRLKTIEEQHERMKAEQAKASEASARTTEIAGLQATILNKNSEIETLKARVVDYEASSEISKKCLKTLQDSIEVMELEKRGQAGLKEQESLSHQANIKALEAAVELGKSESDALENNFNTKLNAEVQRMGEVQKVVQQELEEKMAELNTLRAQVEGGDPEMDKLRANNEEFKQALTMREVDLAALSSKLSSVEAELSLSKDINREGEIREVELQLKLDELAAISAEMDTAAQEEINQLNVLITQHSASIAAKETALETALAAHEEALADKDMELAANSKSLSKLEAQLADQAANATGGEEKIRAELAQLGGVLKESQAEVTARREEVEMYEGQCEKLDSRAREAEAVRVELEAKVAEYEQESKTKGADSNLELLYLQNDVKAHLVKIEQLKQELSNKCEEQDKVTDSYNNQAKQLEALRKDVSQQLDLIENLEHSVQDATDKAEDNNTKYLLSHAEKSELVSELGQSQATLQSQIVKIEGLAADLAKLTADKEETQSQLTASQAQLSEAEGQLTASQGQFSLDNCVNYEMIERGDVEGLGDLVVVQRETVQSLGHSLAEVTMKTENVKRLEKELEKLSADLEASVGEGQRVQKEFNILSKEREELEGQFSVMEEALSVEEKQSELKDSLIERSERECKDQKKRIEKLSKSLATAQEGVVKQEGKSGVKDKQGEKEVTELKGQLNKMTKEAEKNLRENKKTQDKLLDTKASLADLQDKLTKLSEEKRFLEKAMPVAPVTVIEAPKNGSGSKDRELISKLEKELSSLQSEKAKVNSEITSAQWQKQMAVAGGLAGAGVASAVAYLTALYSC